MANEPFLPLFFGDFLASTAEWEGEERALYLLLLGYQWSLGSLPSEPRRICKLVGWDWQLFERCWSTVGAKFKANAGRLLNERLEQHRARSHDISRKRAESGSKGGRAAQANARQVREQMLGNAQANSEQMLVSTEANREANSEQMLGNGEANARNLLDHPSHPIPSHSIPSQESASASSGVVGRAHARKAASAPEDRARKSKKSIGRLPEPDPAETRRKALALLAGGMRVGDVAHALAQYGVTAGQVTAWQREEGAHAGG